MGLIAAIPCPTGLAVAGSGQARILPWPIAAGLLADADLSVVVVDDIPAWHLERLLAALAAGDPAAAVVAAGPTREGVTGLARHPRPWARTIGLTALAGELAAACCRAGLAIPDTADALAVARAAAALAERHRGVIDVRARLAAEHPVLGEHAFWAMPGALAERVVLQGRPRAVGRGTVAAGAVAVRDLLRDPGRFVYRRADTAAAAAAILDGLAIWDERGRLDVHTLGGTTHRVGGVALRFGVGGLHSEDPPGLVAGPLVDWDVASYYPSIIHADGICPPGVPGFSAAVGQLMERRLAAKRAGDRLASEALKIVVNSLYGQLGNARSALWSPPDALRVVLTGQLLLLGLIDDLLEADCELVSANTDGVVVRGVGDAAAMRWQTANGLVLERQSYARLVRTSVNDYLAIAADGRVAKARGAFAGGEDDRRSSRSAAPIIARAAVAHFVDGQAIDATIRAADAVLDFACWRRARDLRWGDEPIHGAVVRWLVSRAGRPIVQVGNGSSRTVAAAALLLADPAGAQPTDVDRGWYVEEARRLLHAVDGTAQGGGGQQSWFA